MKKLIIIIYAAVIAVTGICALAFNQYVSIKIDSLIPVAATVFQIILGLLIKNDIVYYSGGRLHSLKNTDFKYSKNERREGVFNEMPYHRQGPGKFARTAMAYALIIGGALPIPFVAFFSIGAKWCSIGAILISIIVGSAIAIPSDIKSTREEFRAEMARKEQWKKELEEQKKREELGRWK